MSTELETAGVGGGGGGGGGRGGVGVTEDPSVPGRSGQQAGRASSLAASGGGGGGGGGELEQEQTSGGGSSSARLDSGGPTTTTMKRASSPSPAPTGPSSNNMALSKSQPVSTISASLPPDNYDFSIKIVLIGNSGVGKTNLISRFTKNYFSLETRTTLGVEFAYKNLEIDGKKVRVQIWDTAGQERFRAVISAFYRHAVGAILVYDIAKHQSYEDLEKWNKELDEYGTEGVGKMLIGNKIDLRHVRTVPTDEGQKYADEHAMKFMETSALDSTNVEESFTALITEVFRNLPAKQEKSSPSIPLEPAIPQNFHYEEPNKRKWCCPF